MLNIAAQDDDNIQGSTIGESHPDGGDDNEIIESYFLCQHFPIFIIRISFDKTVFLNKERFLGKKHCYVYFIIYAQQNFDT